MITLEEFREMSNDTPLWRVAYWKDHIEVIKSKLNEAKDSNDYYVIETEPEYFFLNKEEAEEYATQLRIIKKLQS